VGRKTYTGLPTGLQPLPGRATLVLSQQPLYATPGAQVFHTMEELLCKLAGSPAAVIGGATVYKAALPYADTIVATEIDTVVRGGDTYFPTLEEDWHQTTVGSWEYENGLRYRLCHYKRLVLPEHRAIRR
jgi:dihydrofolate reductase